MRIKSQYTSIKNRAKISLSFFLIPLVFFALFSLLNCDNSTAPKGTNPKESSTPTTPAKKKIDPAGRILRHRIIPPYGYQRMTYHESSFSFYLQNLPLKPNGAEVLHYNGSVKPNEGGYIAVVDLPIGKKDLHQCADAVMRLRAEYLYHQKRFEDIHFNFTNGFQVDYSKWRSGNRIRVQGNTTSWVKGDAPSTSYKDFWQYLETIFTYAGTYSLSKELKTVSIQDMQIGDIFIQGGFPGHAVIVVDMVQDPTTGNRRFLLAQSYMPAQELHILTNPNNKELSPWYELDFGNELVTPDWLFYEGDLMRFSGPNTQ